MISLRVDDVIMQVEIASSPEERETGLMNRRTLGELEGMLFVFETVGNRGFWMKNTHLPLSIAFVDTGGYILQIENLQPYSLSVVYADHYYKYALEVPRGTFQRYRIEVGDRILLPPL